MLGVVGRGGSGGGGGGGGGDNNDADDDDDDDDDSCGGGGGMLLVVVVRAELSGYLRTSRACACDQQAALTGSACDQLGMCL